LPADPEELLLVVGAMAQDSFAPRIQRYSGKHIIVFVGDRPHIRCGAAATDCSSFAWAAPPVRQMAWTRGLDGQSECAGDRPTRDDDVLAAVSTWMRGAKESWAMPEPPASVPSGSAGNEPVTRAPPKVVTISASEAVTERVGIGLAPRGAEKHVVVTLKALSRRRSARRYRLTGQPRRRLLVDQLERIVDGRILANRDHLRLHDIVTRRRRDRSSRPVGAPPRNDRRTKSIRSLVFPALPATTFRVAV